MANWSFKDPDKGKKQSKGKWYPVKKKKKKKLTRKQRAKELYGAQGDDFYKSPEWLRLRYRVLKKYGGECMACGRSKKHDGVTIHVDHIKPRSKHPNLSLVFDNMQILCEDCNIGKSNLDETDWRPDEVEAELDIVYEAMQHI